MKSIIKILISLVTLLLVMTGCEYDGPMAMYFRAKTATSTPVIDSIDPAVAEAGYNYLTIKGENFSLSIDSSRVYVDGNACEVVDSKSDQITIRRPVSYGNSTTVKVVNYTSENYGIFTPYQIDPVVKPFSGGYLDGSQLSVAAVDDTENVYIFHRSTKSVYKINTDGVQQLLGETSRNVTDVIFSPDNQLVLFMQNKAVAKMDPSTGVESEWISLKKMAGSGDFDSNGNLYSGGKKSDLIVFSANMTETATKTYNEKKDDILCVRVSGNTLYVLALLGEPGDSNPALAIWRHSILDANGAISARELVFDWSSAADPVTATLKFFTVTPDGSLIIGSGPVTGTVYKDPLLIFNPQDRKSDILYKGIISGSSEHLVWSGQNYLYMLQGGSSWQLDRIDMGTLGTL